MTADKVILSSTCNPFYLDFWPIVSMIWAKKFKIHPVLVLIHDDPAVQVSEEFGSVIYQTPIENVPLNVQAQCSRYFFPKLELDTTWLMSDIDMLPISKYYFLEHALSISDDKFVNLNAEVIGGNPACYNLAKGKTYVDVLNLPETFDEFLKMTEWWRREGSHTPAGSDNLIGHNWFTDESYSNEMISKYNDTVDSTKFVNPPRPGGFCQRRIDREAWAHWNAEGVLTEFFLDAHVPRPYSKHRQDIDNLIKLILASN